MITQAENERMTSVGAGTLMGELMRQYWIPALKSTELPSPDCDPVRVMLLGERLVAFRDSRSRVGLLSHTCPHRGASLFLGRNEEGGLRCAYHGWKFAVDGQCLEMPCEPANSALPRRVRARAYPCKERGGIVWAYMGPRQMPPPLPDLEMNMGLEGEGQVNMMLMECNWLQNLEGDLDMDHIAVLHGANIESFKATLRGRTENIAAKSAPGVFSARPRSSQRLRMELADSEVGCTFACDIAGEAHRRDFPLGNDARGLWAIGQFMLPFYSMLPYGAWGAHWVVARVPMDDQHTMTFGIHAGGSAIPSAELMFGPDPAYLPNTTDWFGRFRSSRNPRNDFGLDRALSRQARGAFGVGAGIPGQVVQDACITQSMGPIADRTNEHLGVGDAMVAELRKRLMTAAVELSSKNIPPPGVDLPSGYRMKQGMLRTPPGRSWLDALTDTKSVPVQAAVNSDGSSHSVG